MGEKSVGQPPFYLLNGISGGQFTLEDTLAGVPEITETDAGYLGLND